MLVEPGERFVEWLRERGKWKVEGEEDYWDIGLGYGDLDEETGPALW